MKSSAQRAQMEPAQPHAQTDYSERVHFNNSLRIFRYKERGNMWSYLVGTYPDGSP